MRDLDPKTMIASSSGAASTGVAGAPSNVSARPTTTGSATPAAESASSTPVGAIAGGVVGGVAVLIVTILVAWFFWHRRRRDNTAELHGDLQMLHGSKGAEYGRHDAEGPVVYEMGSKTPDAVLASVRMPDAELAASQRPVELDATERVR